MLPSSATPDGPRSSNLRRFGPLAVIVVIAVIIAIVVIASSGDDDKTTSTSSSAGPASTTRAISFSEAKAQNRTDLTFPAGCDQTTGRVAIPMLDAAECYANQPAVTEPNTRGVTNDTVTVVVYVAPEQDAILDFITAPINNNDTPDQVEQTYQGYTEMFQSIFQTYGRKVELKFLRASGQSRDAVAARADAVKAVEEMGAFAVWGGPALTTAWTEEMKARGVVCLGCLGITEPAPSTYGTLPNAVQQRQVSAEYISKKLNNKPAQFAGDAALQSKTRVFGHLYIDTGADEKAQAADYKQKLNTAGVTLDTQLPFTLDPSTLQTQATTMINQLKSAGVTSVIVQGDPISPKTFTEVATAQEYFPEWIIGPTVLVDVTAFARTYDQRQWAHAFGPSALTARIAPEKADSWSLFQWFKGTPPPAIDSAGVIIPQPQTFFQGLQAAGPKLTMDTFRDGLFSLQPQAPRITEQITSWGNHGFWPDADFNAIDDFTEVWWDPSATGPDEIRKQGSGMYQYVDGGKRYVPGQLPSDLKLFNPAGAVTIYDNPPSGEVPKDYPKPATSAN